jgi:peptide/nickel transport system ATP-binding protein
MLLITRDMGVIAELAHRVAVTCGRIVEIGPAAQVLHAPLHPYTRRLVGCIPRIGTRSSRLVQIPGAMPRLDDIPSGCAFRPRASMPMSAALPFPHSCVAMAAK